MYRLVQIVKGEATKQKILDAAADLIHQHGMNVVSIGDVLKASKTGKSQFYYHFKSRDDLINSVLKLNKTRICELLSKPLESWEDVRNWIFIHAEYQRNMEFNRGCPFGTAAYSLMPDQDREREPLQTILDTMRNRLTIFLENEKKARRLREDTEINKLGSFSVAAIQGALIIGMVEKADKSVLSAMEEAYAHLESFRIN